MRGSVLQGLKVPVAPEAGLARLLRAIAAPLHAAFGRNGEITYSILDKARERRFDARRRTRLRPGKVVDADNRFLVECRIRELSGEGAGLQLVNTDVDIPDFIGVYDDGERSISFADVIWRDGQELGVRIISKSTTEEIDEKTLIALSGKFYAIGA